jgi:hypothetical protein
MTMMLVFAGLLAAIAVVAYQAGVGTKKLECPACDLYIIGARPSEGESVVCPHCRALGVMGDKKLVTPAPDLVARTAQFCSELPQHSPRWPEHCVLCTQPSTRMVRAELRIEQSAALHADMATRMASLGFVKLVDQHTFTLDVPHCAQHADGAKLVPPYEREQPNIGIAFRSYATFQEFVALNRTTPRKAHIFGGQSEVS